MSAEHDDEMFARRLRDAWQPPSLTPADRVRFDAVLRERLAQRARARRWGVGFGLAAAVAAAAFALSTLRGPTEAPPLPTTPIAAAPDVAPLAALIEADAAPAPWHWPTSSRLNRRSRSETGFTPLGMRCPKLACCSTIPAWTFSRLPSK